MLRTIAEYQRLKLDVEVRQDIDEIRYLCRTDLYFLLRYIFGRKDIENQWLLDRCIEVQNEPNGYLDLWSREHYKSTIITFAKSIQDILASHGNDPLPIWGGRECTIGIFSHTRPIAKKFLRQIKVELEGNTRLQELFSDILYRRPQSDAPKWSEDAGLQVKRRTNPKEATIEAWGLVDAMPTGAHFLIRVYDDVVVDKSVTTPDMIDKTTKAWEVSLNLGMADGGIERYIGTRWHSNDTYRTVLQREAAKPRIYPATDTGEFDGIPVFWDKEYLQRRIREMGPYTAAAQLMQNPLADKAKRLDISWVRYYETMDAEYGQSKYILIDPANEKKKSSDYTVMAVIGLGADHNYYLLDIIRDRLNLYERVEALFFLHRRWKPVGVAYESYGLKADVQHLRYVQGVKNYHFDITEISNKISGRDRVAGLIPLFASHRFYIPESIHRTNYEGVTQDLIRVFLEDEYQCWPVPVHDDMLVAISFIQDEAINLEWPALDEDKGMDRYSKRERYDRRPKRSWRSV